MTMTIPQSVTPDISALRLNPEDSLREAVVQRREGFWFPEPKREALLKSLHLLANDPPRLRERSIAIIAEANNGKSALLAQYLERHPRLSFEDRNVVPCIVIDMSKLKRVEDLSVALLKALGDVDPEDGNHTRRLERFVALSREVGLQLTFLDEFHEAATVDKGAPILKCIKGLMNDNVRIVPVGIESLQEVFHRDMQLSSRFQFGRGRLERITDKKVIGSLMVHISGLLSTEINPAAVPYVLEQTSGVFGHVCDLIENTFLATGALTLEGLKAERELMDCLDHVHP